VTVGTLPSLGSGVALNVCVVTHLTREGKKRNELVLKATVKGMMKEMNTMDTIRSITCDCIYEASLYNQNGLAVGFRITPCDCEVIA